MSETNIKDIYNKIEKSEKLSFFKTQDSQIYVSISTKKFSLNVNIDSLDFANYLKLYFYKKENLVLSDTTIQTIVSLLKANMFFTLTNEEPIFCRIGTDDKYYYYNIDNYICIKYGGGNPELLENQPVKFITEDICQAVPCLSTEHTKLLDYIKKYFNFRNDKELYVFTSWLLYCFITDSKQVTVIHPILILTGKQGSGKTTALDFINRIVAPSSSTLENIHKDEDLITTLSNNYISTFDNIRSITSKIQDVLCRACTGGTVTKRKLYTNNETVSIKYKSIIAINGISDSLASNSDFLDRSILINLKPITYQSRESITTFNQDFSEDLPNILGSIFNSIHLIIAETKQVEINESPRFKDFAIFGVAFYKVFNLKGDFLKDYKLIIDKTKEISINSNIIIETLVYYIKKEKFAGTASELILTLQEYAEDNCIILPNNMQPNKISELISNYEGTLNDIGIAVDRRKSNGVRKIIISNKFGE